MRRRLVVAAVVFGLVLAAGAWWLFGAGGLQPSGTVAAPVTGDVDPGQVEYVLVEPTVASFILSEELRGSPQVVVGTSDAVVGRVLVDPIDPAASRIGEIRINARAFTTDSALRDRALRGRILQSDTFEFVTFVPTRIEGLVGPVEPGDDVSFTVIGDLTIGGVTREVPFDVTLTFGGDRLEGEAVAHVLRSDFGLQIPSVPNVANVGDQVEIVLDFVAVPA